MPSRMWANPKRMKRHAALVPAWIEADEARVTAVFEGPFGRGWRLIAQDGDDVVAEARQLTDGSRTEGIRGNRILEQRVEHRVRVRASCPREAAVP